MYKNIATYKTKNTKTPFCREREKLLRVHVPPSCGQELVIRCSGVVPNSDPCQIITPLVLVGLGLGVGEGLGLGVGLVLGNHSDFDERDNNLAGGRKWARLQHG